MPLRISAPSSPACSRRIAALPFSSARPRRPPEPTSFLWILSARLRRSCPKRTKKPSATPPAPKPGASSPSSGPRNPAVCSILPHAMKPHLRLVGAHLYGQFLEQTYLSSVMILAAAGKRNPAPAARSAYRSFLQSGRHPQGAGQGSLSRPRCGNLR